MSNLSFIALLMFAAGLTFDQPVTPGVEIIEPTQTLRIRVHSSALFRSKKRLLRISIPHPDKLSVIQHSPTQFELQQCVKSLSHSTIQKMIKDCVIKL